MTRHIFVEKNAENAIEARGVLSDLRDNLGIEGIGGARVINRYTLYDFNEADFAKCAYTVFAEPPVDILYCDAKAFEATIGEDDAALCVAYLPGQFDSRADSAKQCVEAVTGSERGEIKSAKVYVFMGIGRVVPEKIIKYLINPVDSQTVDLYATKDIEEAAIPSDVAVIEGFRALDDAGMDKLSAEMGLAMSPADICCVREYFIGEKRDPTVTELRVLDTYWSDHCRHTTFLTELTDISFEDGTEVIQRAYIEYLELRKELYKTPKPVTLMDIATIGVRALIKRPGLEDLDASEEINACGITTDIDIDGEKQKYLILFKNETHNHPTEIEPYGGAATCLGGAIRDPLSGRAYVYQAMRVTGGPNPNTPICETMPGKLPPRKITIGAAQGYSSYGNQIGIATGVVREIFDDAYVAKRMEIGAVIGAVKFDDIRRERPAEGDVVVLVGGGTGRDGCGGATGSSKGHNVNSISICGAEVQKGNPPTERKLQRFFRDKRAMALIKRCNDFGAGGVAVAVGELADGLYINLDSVPKKYDGLDGTELAISESQERMAVVCDASDVAELTNIAARENLESAVIAQVTKEPRLCMAWRGRRIVNISRKFLSSNGGRQVAAPTVTRPKIATASISEAGIKDLFLQTMSDLNVCSQKGLAERFDASIGAGTVLMPFGGTRQLSPIQAMAALIPTDESQRQSTAITLMAHGFNPTIAKHSPFHGAVCAVVESVSKLVATGGKSAKARLTLQEYFERLRDDPRRWGKPFAALLGALHAQMGLGIPAVGGKDSMSGSFNDLDVPPTLVSFAICVGDVKDVVSPEFKASGNNISFIETRTYGDGLPDFAALKTNWRLIEAGIANGDIISAYAVGFGGVAAACAQMGFGNGIGFNITLTGSALFEPSYGSFVVETANGALQDRAIGSTTLDDTYIINGASIPHKEVLSAWAAPLERVFPASQNDNPPPMNAIAHFRKGVYQTPRVCRTNGRPRVFVPIFPGTNTEYDAKESFTRAGAEVDTFVLRNLNIFDLRASIVVMAKRLKEAQILFLPGGFSAGDEPDGSGKYIAAIFRNAALNDAVSELLEKRGGLILGICNGAQALMKLGLAAYGDIRDITKESPTLTFNAIGRHVSKICRTKIMSNLSPWLAGRAVGDIISVAVSHGEGRFTAGDGEMKQLVANGQIAGCYVDSLGNPTMDDTYNPNGSYMAVEAITSPDGRILAKMGHNERSRENTYKNVPGDYDSRIFESGVKYFS